MKMDINELMNKVDELDLKYDHMLNEQEKQIEFKAK